MKRFLKIFSLLVVGLFALVTGVDSALGHLSASTTKSSLIVYNEKGTVVLAYEGDLNDCKILAAKPGPVVSPSFHFLHRT